MLSLRLLERIKPMALLALCMGSRTAVMPTARVTPVLMADAQSDGICHILSDKPGWLCDVDSCLETPLVLCTSRADVAREGMHCVLQPGLTIDGMPVWACAPSPQQPVRTHRISPLSLPQPQLQLGGRRAIVSATAWWAVVAYALFSSTY